MVGTDHALELEARLRIPQPLDPHIASVTITTGSNNPADHFDLMMSASFGSEYVILSADTDRIEVRISIKKAEIHFDTINCRLHLFGGNAEGWKEKVSEKSETTKGVQFGVGVDLNQARAGMGVTGNASIGHNRNEATTKEREGMPWRIQSENTIQIGYQPEFSEILSGRILNEEVRVRVAPIDVSQKVGILARLRVRERWIEIEDFSPRAASRKLNTFFKSLSSDKFDERRRLFSRLLAHLVAVELQADDDTRDATLAASAIVYSPRLERVTGVTSPPSLAEIQIDPTAIEQFIAAKVGTEAATLRSLGVDIDIPGFSPLHQIIRKAGLRSSQFQIDTEELAELYSASFGYWVWVTPMGDALQASVGPSSHDTLRIHQIYDRLLSGRTEREAEDLLFKLGVVTRGHEAFLIVRCLGFQFRYQTLISRMKKRSRKSRFGHLVTYWELLEVCDLQSAVSQFVGAEFFIRSPTRGLDTN